MSELLRFLPRKAEGGGVGMDGRLSEAEGGILERKIKTFVLKVRHAGSDHIYVTVFSPIDAKETNTQTWWE